MCIRCAAHDMISNNHEALDWMRTKLRNVPTEHVITFALLLEETVVMSMKPPQPCENREQAVELLTAYFWVAKQDKDKFSEHLKQAFSTVSSLMEQKGYAA